MQVISKRQLYSFQVGPDSSEDMVTYGINPESVVEGDWVVVEPSTSVVTGIMDEAMYQDTYLEMEE